MVSPMLVRAALRAVVLSGLILGLQLYAGGGAETASSREVFSGLIPLWLCSFVFMLAMERASRHMPHWQVPRVRSLVPSRSPLLRRIPSAKLGP